MLYRDGVPLEVIAKAFGHSSVEVTRAHYAFASEDQMLDVARKQTDVIPEAKSESAEPTDEEKLWPESMDDLNKILGF